MFDDHDAELLRIGLRNDVERRPLARESSLEAALRKVPGRWTKAICEALGRPVSNRDPERKAAILEYLAEPGSLREVWRNLPGESRRIVSWLVLEKDGSASARELYGEFGEDDDYSYHWNKSELPTTALGLLRLHGLVFKGMAANEWGREKVAVVPVELRRELASIARTMEDIPAPPMPEPANRKRSGLWERLEVEDRFRGTGRPESDVFLFKVVLKEVEPAVWRTILVPGRYSFWDLHVAVQDAMGWLDYHLHEFRLRDALGGREVVVGFPGYDSFEGRRPLTEYLVSISDYASGGPIEYLYDYGDEWLHEVTLEEVLPAVRDARYPVCTAGEGACPPEDCGGPPGYARFLEAIADPEHGDHEEMLEWVGGSFDPARFDPRTVHFEDPSVRWNLAYLGDESARELLQRSREAADRAPEIRVETEGFMVLEGPGGAEIIDLFRYTSRPEGPPVKKRPRGSRSSGHKWQFKARFRTNAYGWRGTSPASKRLREAVSEIRKVARKDPVTAADGVVALFERLWPALQCIDSSSGALGVAVNRAIESLIPVLTDAPADIDTRRGWLDRLYDAVCADGVDFLFPVECRWGEICAFPELIDYWIDFLMPGLADHLKDPGAFFTGEGICLSCLLEAGRYDELRELISMRRYKFWPYDRFWAEALLRMGRVDDALEFAESMHPDDYEEQSILEFCERVLLEDGQRDTAYYEYGLGVRSGNTYLANYRAIVRKYPERDPEEILRDLVETSVDRGKWFAAARHAGYLEVARDCARSGLVQPKTLVNAARDAMEKDPGFSYEVALRALDLMLQGYGYELAVIDILPAFEILFEAAAAMGVEDWATAAVTELLSREIPSNVPECEQYLRGLLGRRQREQPEPL